MYYMVYNYSLPILLLLVGMSLCDEGEGDLTVLLIVGGVTGGGVTGGGVGDVLSDCISLVEASGLQF